MLNDDHGGTRGGASDNYVGTGGIGGGYDPAAPYNPYEKLEMPEPPETVIDMDRVRIYEPFTNLKDKLPPALPGSSAKKNAGATKAIVGGLLVGLVIGLVFFT
jgi:hypothetical protein